MRDFTRDLSDAAAKLRQLAPISRARWFYGFFAAYALLACIYSLAIGPFRGPDERNHFLRSYQISEGRLASSYRISESLVGGDLPASLSRLSEVRGNHQELHIEPQQIATARSLSLDPARRQFAEFSTAVYAPLAYVPAASAIAVGRAVGAGPLSLVYLARWGNLLVACALSVCDFARRIRPASRMCHRALPDDSVAGGDRDS